MSEKLLGKTLGGCEIIEIIGHGGMGVIFKARQKSLDRIVAMKVLAAKLAMDMNFVARFQREARAIARVNHPNILAVYDVGSEDDVYYMIMELIEGESLAELQQRLGGGPLKTEDGMKYVKAAAQGLEAAHATGITHRDIKPENLMITNKGVIKVSDFGLAKETDATGATSTDAVMGTPAFMSPEQCDGKKVDGRSDIYSLGGTFYKLITGRLPFEAETAMSMMYRHKHEALIPPREIVSTIPSPISDIIVKMMAKKPPQRMQSMTEVVEALEKAERGELSAAPVTVMLPASSGAAPPNAEPRIVLPRAPNSAIPPPAGAGGSARMMGAAPPAEPPPPGQSGRLSRRPKRDTDRMGRADLRGAGAASSAQIPGGLALGPGNEDSFTLVARGDEMIGRGDRTGGLKCYRQALQAGGLDGATIQRLEQEIRNEIGLRKQAGESLLKRGMLVEAAREYRLLADLDVKEDSVRTTLKDIEGKLAAKRTVINDVRTAIAGAQFEKAIELWDRTPTDLRDEALGKQIDHLRNVVVPSLKLCEQAETYNQQGRLDEAVATFEDALRIDEHCDRARQGLGESEGKRQRIEIMLKEGYDYALQQDYERAIEIWMPIVHLQPGHPRAVKGIIDGFSHIARDRRGKGDYRGALQALKEAKEVDPQNRGVLRELEQMTELHDKELALIDRANDAIARGRTGEAIRYWEEVRKINPANKQCREKIEELKKKRGKSTAKLFAVLAIVLLVAGAGYQVATEYLTRARVYEQLDALNFTEAINQIDEQFWLLHKQEMQTTRLEAVYGDLILRATIAERKGELLEAARLYREAAALLKDRDPTMLYVKAAQLESQHYWLEGDKALEAKEWAKAKEHYQKVQECAKDEKAKGDRELEDRRAQAQKSIVFAEHVERAVKYANGNRRADAIEELIGANRIRPGHPYVKEFLSTLGMSSSQYETKVKEAVDALQAPWVAGNLAKARAALTEADRANPRQTYVKNLQGYLQAMEECAQGGMALYNQLNPGDENAMTHAWRSDAFCVDTYEYRKKGEELPLAGVSWLEARSLCAAEGKTLCAENKWQKACQGKQAAARFPWGADAAGGKCNWSSGQAAKSGSFESCRSDIGTFDMSGNLAEWVDASESAQEAKVSGGSFQSEADGATCYTHVSQKKEKSRADVGFRCCKSLSKGP
ncbi:MAG: protein kinase [Planctomycetota bacterium]|nr:protein kinase [Planctomycetota bacterium]